MTATGTRPATRCSRCSARRCAAACAPATSPAAGAARSSSCCCTTPTSTGALQAAETMRASFEGLEVPGVTAHVTASLGVATLPDHADDGPALIRAADRALYSAKTAGRNQVAAAAQAEQAIG